MIYKKINMAPDVAQLQNMMLAFRSLVFPDCFPYDGPQAVEILGQQLSRVMGEEKAHGLCASFASELSELSRLLHTDVEAVAQNDPAASCHEEIILCYPAVKVMMHYRVAHALHKLGVPVIPRVLTELAHSETGIDIHPAATIGEYFSIDHGTGIVIGATSVIGNHVMLYQGVTLGAKNFRYSPDGSPMDIPRHPILEDNVTVYSNTSILGRVRIGHDTVVGGNVWLTRDVPPHSRILQTSALLQPLYEDGSGI